MRMEFGPALYPGRIVEFAALVVLLAVAIFYPGFLSGFARRANAWLDSFSTRRFASYGLLFALPVVLRLALLPIYPPPHQQIHDDHSFILQADTFAHFQLTNPPLRPGDPLEEQYMLSRPTRQSIYPPAQGLGLAIGILLFRNPWAGVLIETGSLCAILFWSLSRWAPRRWAFRASLYFALFLGVMSYWTNSFHGGSVNAIGGLLMWGVMPRLRVVGPTTRLRRGPRVADGLLFALGFLIAVDSRPVEAMVFVLLAMAWIFWPFVRARKAFPARVIAGAAACVAVGAALNGYYNWKVTGHPLLPGYLAQQKLFGVPQNFYFQPAAVGSSFDFPDIHNEYLRQLALWQRGRSPRGFVLAAAGKIRRAWAFYVGVALTPLLFALPWAWRSRGVPAALLFIAAIFGLHLFYHSYYPHYEGCIFGAIAFVLIECWRRLRLWRPSARISGASLCRVLPVVAFIGIVAPLGARIIDGPPELGKWYAEEFYYPRAPRRMLDHFEAMPGKLLLLIHYSEDHDPNDDWIFNDRNPATSKMVIARDVGEASDRALLRRFPGRQCWAVDAESVPPRARPCDFGRVVTAAQK